MTEYWVSQMGHWQWRSVLHWCHVLFISVTDAVFASEASHTSLPVGCRHHLHDHHLWPSAEVHPHHCCWHQKPLVQLNLRVLYLATVTAGWSLVSDAWACRPSPVCGEQVPDLVGRWSNPMTLWCRFEAFVWWVLTVCFHTNSINEMKISVLRSQNSDRHHQQIAECWPAVQQAVSCNLLVCQEYLLFNI